MMFRVDDAFRATGKDEARQLSVTRMPDTSFHSVTFGGYADERKCREQLKILLSMCGASETPPVWFVAEHDPPYRFWGRTNMVMVEMK